MSTRTTLIVTLAMVAIAVAFSAAVYGKLPEQMASHWNINDQVDGTMPRLWGAFLMPLVSLAMLGLFLLIPNIDPLKANIAKFRETFNTFIALIVAFLLYTYFLTILWNLGYQNFRMGQAILPAIGLIFIFAGLMMMKAKRNFFIGIRTPWTLSNDRVWDETHRVGSRLFIIMGVITMLTIFFGEIGIYIMMTALLIAVIVPVVYSYVLYKEETKG
ncbi:MAG: SdpI family protein [Chloroflexi bacterium]|nr:SdpI family protein [Chloroflexota bacterium]MBI3339998.1 SdpI family protein [Chloroflexota bacterium]